MRTGLLPLIGIAALAVAFAFLFLFLPKRAFSDNENRTLTQRPQLTMKAALDGSYQREFEDYLADQFPFRDLFFSLSVRAQRLAGKKEVNGVFYARDEGGLRLIDVYEKPGNTEKFIGAVARLSEKLERAKVTLLTVPTAVTLYGDALPAFSGERMPIAQTETLRQILEGTRDSAGEASAAITGGTPVDNTAVTELLSLLAEGRESGEEIFYRTDHHWTTRGAFCGYLALTKALGLPGDESKAARLTAVSDTFYGTTWSKVCDPSISADSIEIYENPGWAGTLHVRYEDTGEEADTPYNREYLEKKDKYSLFLNNLHTLVTIENPAADLARTEGGAGGRRALAVVKDSYANCLLPFLIDHYETIYVFDPRYYRGGISSFVNDHPEVEDVLVLYNLGTLDSDRGVGAIN